MKRLAGIALIGPIGVLGLVALGYLGIALASGEFDIRRWFTSTRLSLSPTLAEVARRSPVERLVSAEYYGEVIASFQEVLQAQTDLEEGLRAYYDASRAAAGRGDSLPEPADELQKLAQAMITDLKRKVPLEQYLAGNTFQGAWSAQFRDMTDLRLVYLARGRVRYVYDLSQILLSARCQLEGGTEVVEASDCTLLEASEIVLTAPAGAHSVAATINPYFFLATSASGEADEKASLWGYEVIDEDIDQRFSIVRLVRGEVHRKLIASAEANGLACEAALSMANTVQVFSER